MLPYVVQHCDLITLSCDYRTQIVFQSQGVCVTSEQIILFNYFLTVHSHPWKLNIESLMCYKVTVKCILFTYHRLIM